MGTTVTYKLSLSSIVSPITSANKFEFSINVETVALGNGVLVIVLDVEV